MVWRVADELLYTRRVTDATYAEALARARRAAAVEPATIAAYYEYVSMLLERRSLSVAGRRAAGGRGGCACASCRSRPTSSTASRTGAVTARPPIPNEDTERAIAALGASVERDDELPQATSRQAACSAVMAAVESHARDRRSRRSRYRFRDGAARYAFRLGRDVRGGARRVRRARPRQSDGLDGPLEHSLRAAGAGRRCVRALITTRRTSR